VFRNEFFQISLRGTLDLRPRIEARAGRGPYSAAESGREVLMWPVVGSADSTAEVVSADEAKREALYVALTEVSPRGRTM